MFIRRSSVWLTLLLPVLLSGCESTSVTTLDADHFSETSSGSRSAHFEQLAPGDMIEISVEVDGRQEVPSFQADVNHLGFVTLPLIGDVHVGGVGVDIARSVIARQYAAYYVSTPVIMIARVDEDRANEWGQVSIMGRVKNPGPVPLPSSTGIKLSAAIQAAGGFAPSAKKSEIRISRLSAGGKKVQVYVNYDDIGKAGDATADLNLLDGDIVYIPERVF